MKTKKVYFIFTKSQGFVGRAITFFSKYDEYQNVASHVLSCFYSHDMNCWVTLEALSDGIFMRPIHNRIEYIEKCGVAVYEGEFDELDVEKSLREVSGLKYDFLLTLGHIFPSVANRFGKSNYVPILNSKKRMNCSEIFASILEKKKVGGFFSSMTPTQFLYRVSSETMCKLFRPIDIKDLISTLKVDLDFVNGKYKWRQT